MRSIGFYLFIATFVAGIAIGSVFAISWPYVAACMMLIGFCAPVAWQMKYPAFALILLAICILCSGMVRAAVVPRTMPRAFDHYVGQKVSFKGTIVELPDIRESSDRLTVEITLGEARTRIIAAAPLYPKVHVGDIVNVSGVFAKPQSFATDGGRTFDYADFLRKDGVFAVMQPARVEVVGKSQSIWLRLLRGLEYAGDTFEQAIARALPEPESALAVGLVVGGKQGLGKQLLADFTAAGMLQIVVLSGYNVMIVADGVLVVLTFLPKRLAALCAGIAIVLFVLAAGASASALRAGIMAVFALIARVTGKQYDVLRMLLTAFFLLLLWNPLLLLYDPGFQFSFLATIGLLIGTPLLMARMTVVQNVAIREMFSTTIAAQLGVLPLLLWQTGNLSLVSVLANVLVMPVVPFAMAASTIAAVFAFPLGVLGNALPVIAGYPAYLLLAYIIRVATVSASLPYAQIILPPFSLWLVIISYAFLIADAWRLSQEPDAVRRRVPSI